MTKSPQQKFNDSVQKIPQHTDEMDRIVPHPYEDLKEGDLEFTHWEIFNFYLNRWCQLDEGIQGVKVRPTPSIHCPIFGVHRDSLVSLRTYDPHTNKVHLKKVLTTEDEFIGFENLTKIVGCLEPSDFWEESLKGTLFHSDLVGCEFSFEGINSITFTDFYEYTTFEMNLDGKGWREVQLYKEWVF